MHCRSRCDLRHGTIRPRTSPGMMIGGSRGITLTLSFALNNARGLQRHRFSHESCQANSFLHSCRGRHLAIHRLGGQWQISALSRYSGGRVPGWLMRSSKTHDPAPERDEMGTQNEWESRLKSTESTYRSPDSDGLKNNDIH